MPLPGIWGLTKYLESTIGKRENTFTSKEMDECSCARFFFIQLHLFVLTYFQFLNHVLHIDINVIEVINHSSDYVSPCNMKELQLLGKARMQNIQELLHPITIMVGHTFSQMLRLDLAFLSVLLYTQTRDVTAAVF